MKGKFILIGGGSSFEENTSINKRILELTQKKNPKILFIPTASSDAYNYWELFNKYFTKLKARTDVLFLIREKPSKKEIEHKILSADAIYVGGGNTLKIMKLWRKLEVDKVLKKAQDKGIVLSGLSAGSICWCTYGTSDSRKFSNPQAPLIRVKGLGFLDILHCPHYNNNTEKNKGRKIETKTIMKRTKQMGICIDDNCALEINNNSYSIHRTKKNSHCYKVYWNKGKYYEEKLKDDGDTKLLFP